MPGRSPGNLALCAASLLACVASAAATAAGPSSLPKHACKAGSRLLAGYCRTLIAYDTYSRALGPGELGPSNRGGLWSVYTTRTVAVDGRAAQAVVAPAKTNRDYLNAVKCGDCDVEIDVRWDRLPTGSGAHFYLCARTNPAGNPAGYSLLLDSRAAPAGTVLLQLAKYDSQGRRTLLGRPFSVTGSYKPDTFFHLRFRLLGKNLYGSAWLRGTKPPARWQVHAVDASFRRGGVGLRIVNTQQAQHAPLYTVDNLAAYRLSN
ncbi:MAG: hypothetical protein ACJ76I_14400 [Gaiellaceae bacterium]